MFFLIFNTISLELTHYNFNKIQYHVKPDEAMKLSGKSFEKMKIILNYRRGYSILNKQIGPTCQVSDKLEYKNLSRRVRIKLVLRIFTTMTIRVPQIILKLSELQKLCVISIIFYIFYHKIFFKKRIYPILKKDILLEKRIAFLIRPLLIK